MLTLVLYLKVYRDLYCRVDEKNLREKLSEFGKIISMRVKAGVKAFGGSICYCQYDTPVGLYLVYIILIVGFGFY